jgi:cytochrome P450
MMISQSTIIAKPRAPALDAGTQRGGRFIENFLVRRRKVAAFEGVSWRMEGSSHCFHRRAVNGVFAFQSLRILEMLGNQFFKKRVAAGASG